MAYDKVTICNVALSDIRAEQIDSLSEDSVSAIACNKVYAQALETTLQGYNWSFARSQSQLALIDYSVRGWDYCYKMPNTCAQPIEIYRDLKRTHEAIEFETQYCADFDCLIICTNEAKATLIFTSSVDNPVLFSPLFVEALRNQLAMSLLIPLKGNSKDMAIFQSLYTKAMQQACTQDSGTQFIKYKRDNPLRRARYYNHVDNCSGENNP